MSRWLLFICLWTFFVAVLGHGVDAAQIGCDHAFERNPSPYEIPYEEERWPLGSRPSLGTCYMAFIIGHITKGDYDKVEKMLSSNHPFLSNFTISSPGGDVGEAIKMGTLFRKYLIEVSGPEGDPRIGFRNIFDSTPGERCNTFHIDCGCASACALIWFGAVHRTGIVGLHRPRIEDQAFKSLPADSASKLYRAVLTNVASYLKEMDTPERLIQAMVNTGSTEVIWVKADHEIERPSSIAEWTDASCPPLSSDERQLENELQAKSQVLEREKAKLSEKESIVLKALWNKEFAHDDCQTILWDSNREKLPRP